MIFENNNGEGWGGGGVGGGGGGGWGWKRRRLGKNGPAFFSSGKIFPTCYTGTLRVKNNKVDL